MFLLCFPFVREGFSTYVLMDCMYALRQVVCLFFFALLLWKYSVVIERFMLWVLETYRDLTVTSC